MSHVFVTDREFARIGPMSANSEAGYALTQAFQSVGVPRNMLTYNNKELTQGAWVKRIKENQVKQTISEPHIQFHNKAETLI